MPIPTPVRRLLIAGAVIVLSGGIFVWDTITPLVFANYVLYVVPVLVALGWGENYRFAVLVATGCTLLTMLGAFLGPRPYDLPAWITMSNRVFGMLAIWVPVVFFLQRRRGEEALRRLNSELEQRVLARTRELADVNQALVAEVTDRMHTEESLRQSQHDLHGSEERLRLLAAQLITVQDEERRRISRELHDDINQRLAMLAVDLRSLEKRLSAVPEFVRSGLHAAVDQVATLSDDVRTMAYRFHPSILDDLGLSAALQNLVDDFAIRTDIRSRFLCDNPIDPLPKDIASCLYRVTQECLSNVAKHARTSWVTVRVARDPVMVQLTVKDGGKGFDLERLHASHGGLGILSIAERVRLINGTVDVDSKPGEGTTVCVHVPIALDEAP
jgi:signal transduction histidine kinase